MSQLEKSKVNVSSRQEDDKEFIKNNKLILKAQQRFKSEKQNVFTEEVNKIALSANDDKRTIKKLCIWNERGFNMLKKRN